VAGDQLCEPSQILSDVGQNKLILSASRSAKSNPTEPQDALQMREPHLDPLALPSQLLEALGTSERPGSVPGMFASEATVGTVPGRATSRDAIVALR
jgi:hypothetical protein